MHKPLMNKTRITVFFALLAFAALPAFGEGLPLLGAAVAAADESSSQRDSSYRDGRKALDDERWVDAVSHFGEVVGRGGKDTAAALYWKAYAHHKAGERGAALASLAQLESNHSQSRWRNDGKTLRMEIQGHTDETEAGGDDELKLLALNSLMHMEGERAVEMVERFLTGNRSEELRNRALFVLSQNPTERARKILTEAARGTRGEDLRQPAIRFLGMAGASSELQGLYATGDNKIKKAVLQAYMLSQDSSSVLEIYRSEKDQELRQAAVHQLGVMQAQEELRGLYNTETSQEVRTAILQSLFIAGDADGLIEIYQTESDPKLKKKAVRSLGLTHHDKARGFLTDLYGRESDREIKGEVLQALFLAQATPELIKIIGGETDPQLKEKAIKSLGLVHGEESRKALLEIYRSDSSAEIKKSVLQGLFLNQAAPELIEIARAETDQELRKYTIRQLGMIQSDEAVEFMMEILEEE